MVFLTFIVIITIFFNTVYTSYEKNNIRKNIFYISHNQNQYKLLYKVYNVDYDD